MIHCFAREPKLVYLDAAREKAVQIAWGRLAVLALHAQRDGRPRPSDRRIARPLVDTWCLLKSEAASRVESLKASRKHEYDAAVPVVQERGDTMRIRDEWDTGGVSSTGEPGETPFPPTRRRPSTWYSTPTKESEVEHRRKDA